MYKSFKRFLAVVLLGLTLVLTPQTPAQASLKWASTCNLHTGFSYTVSATLSGNGLIYVALADAGGSSEANMQSRAQIIIHVVDPNSPNCKILATYRDSQSYSAISVQITPAIARTDSLGNVYVGKIAKGGFRTVFIPATAPVNNPLLGLKATTISGLPAGGNDYVTHGGMAVTDKYILMTASKYVAGQKLYSKYAVLPIASVQSGVSTSASWADFSSMPAFGQQYSSNDSVEGLPDGSFYMSGSFELGSKFTAAHVFLDPVNKTLKGAVSKSPNTWDILPCDYDKLLMYPYGCYYPSARLGADSNLYTTYTAGEKETGAKFIYGMKYDTTQKKWIGINDTLYPERITAFNGKDANGTGIVADADGKAYFAGTNRFLQGLILANYENSKWINSGYNFTNVELSKPALLFSPYGSGSRLSVFVVLWKPNGADIVWTTNTGNFNITLNTCTPTVVLEDGAATINKTKASGIIYVSSDCTAAYYIAKVSSSATPPTAALTASDYQKFDIDNPTISVSGLAANAKSYVHVKMFDASKNTVSDWESVKISTDTEALVGATATLTSPYNIQKYNDRLAMGGSSYADSAYVRDTVGRFTVTGVSDPSGLDSYKINESTTSFSPSMIGSNQSVILTKSSIRANKVGVTVALTDGAGNVETRLIESLTFDNTPPVIVTNPGIAFTPGASSYDSTVTLSGGTITDNLYPGDAGAHQYWGVWVANAVCTAASTGCLADTNTTLNWAAVKTPSPYNSFAWNLHNGLNTTPITTGSEFYRTYIKFLDGAGNPTATSIYFDTTVTSVENTLFVPLIRVQR